MLTNTKETSVVQSQATKDISVVQVKVTKDTSLKAKFNVITLTLAIIGLTSVVDVPAGAAAAAAAKAATGAAPAAATKTAAGAAAKPATPTPTAAGSTLEARAEKLSEVCLRTMDKVVKELKYPDIPNTGWGRRSHDCLQALMGLVLYTWRINLSRMVPPGKWGTWLGEKAQVDEISRLNEEVKQKIRRIDEFNNQTPTDQDEISKEIQLQIQRNLAWRYWLAQMRTIKHMQDFTVPTLTKDKSGKERTYTPQKMNEIIMAFWALLTQEGKEELERKSSDNDDATTVRSVIVDALCAFAYVQSDDTTTIGIGTVYNRLKQSKLVDIKSPHPILNPKDVNNTDKNKKENGQLYNELKDVNKLSDDLRLEQTELFQDIFKEVDAKYDQTKKDGEADIQKMEKELPPGQPLEALEKAVQVEIDRLTKELALAAAAAEVPESETDKLNEPLATPLAAIAPVQQSAPAPVKATSAPLPISPAANTVQPPAPGGVTAGVVLDVVPTAATTNTTPAAAADSVTKSADPTPAATKANPALPAKSPPAAPVQPATSDAKSPTANTAQPPTPAAQNNVPPAAPVLRKSASLPPDAKKSNSGSVLGRATSALRTYTQKDLQEIARQRDALMSVLPSIPSLRRRAK